MDWAGWSVRSLSGRYHLKVARGECFLKTVLKGDVHFTPVPTSFPTPIALMLLLKLTIWIYESQHLFYFKTPPIRCCTQTWQSYSWEGVRLLYHLSPPNDVFYNHTDPYLLPESVFLFLSLLYHHCLVPGYKNGFRKCELCGYAVCVYLCAL